MKDRHCDPSLRCVLARIEVGPLGILRSRMSQRLEFAVVCGMLLGAHGQAEPVLRSSLSGSVDSLIYFRLFGSILSFAHFPLHLSLSLGGMTGTFSALW